MILILLLIAASAIVVWNIKNELSNEHWSMKIAAWCLASLFSVSLVCLATLVIGILTNAYVEDHRINESTPIYSLRNDTSINGSFFLGSGSVSDTEYYYMFTRDSRGGYERCKLPIYNCYLFQDENNSPHFSWQTIVYRPSKWLYVGPPIRWKDRTKYDIHVPENTIIQKYEVK